MAGFEELGIRESLVANAHEQGFDTPSAIQKAVIPVIRRGGNAVIRASSGSGVTAAYGLALLDRFADESGSQALVIVPTADRAERVAGTIARLAHGTGARVAALTNTWSPATDANIIVASAEKLLKGLKESQINIEHIGAVVVDGAAAIARLNGVETLETLFASLPREGQRVFVAAELTDEIKKLAEAHAHKALYFPTRPAVEPRAPREPVEPAFKLRYAVASGGRKADLVGRFARQQGDHVTLLCTSAASAHAAERDLSGRGFSARGVRYEEFERDQAKGAVIAYDAPFSAEQIKQSLRDGDLVICERHQLSHLKTIAADANVQLDAATMPTFEADSLNAFRNEIRRAVREEDLDAQMLVLEPLFQEMSAEEVAAAAAALLRARRPNKPEAANTGRPNMKTWSRLFLSVGERDGMRPGDLVGAITGESGIKGEEVGKVEIRDTFSVVEVDSTVADRVIRALNGTTMKNRSLRVDYDRKTSAGTTRGTGRGTGTGRSGGGRPPGRRGGGGSFKRA
jgi:ATP-dependent RNA helicase DeaD